MAQGVGDSDGICKLGVTVFAARLCAGICARATPPEDLWHAKTQHFSWNLEQNHACTSVSVFPVKREARLHVGFA